MIWSQSNWKNSIFFYYILSTIVSSPEYKKGKQISEAVHVLVLELSFSNTSASYVGPTYLLRAITGRMRFRIYNNLLILHF